MKIYFAGSICGGRDDKDFYLEIIKFLRQYGTVLTEHVGDQKLSVMGDKLASQDIYKRDMAWLQESDVLVTEVSTPSLGVGYELAKAEGHKKILCLYREQEGRRLSAMIDGNNNFLVKHYKTLEDVKMVLQEFFGGVACLPVGRHSDLL